MSPSAAGASSEKKCRLTIGCGSSALRWTTARAEFAPVCRESCGHRRCAGCLEMVGCDAALDAWRNVSCDAALDAWWWGVR
mgnify:FL=1